MKDVRGIKNEAGFSLVELMVVVAIIGILASLAIPSVGKYMAKARQSEAKTQLSSIYTSEKAFYAEYTAYHSMFGAIGYSPEGKLRYLVGMGNGGANEAGPANGYTTVPAAPGNVRDTNAYCGAAGAMLNGCSMLNGANNALAATYALPAGATGPGAASTFVAGATAIVYQAQNDEWTINQNKVLTNTINGIQ